jgi:hypothetical protein
LHSKSQIVIRVDQVAVVSRAPESAPRLGYLKEKGIGEDFQHQIRDKLQPGTSALLWRSSAPTLPRRSRRSANTAAR